MHDLVYRPRSHVLCGERHTAKDFVLFGHAAAHYMWQSLFKIPWRIVSNLKSSLPH